MQKKTNTFMTRKNFYLIGLLFLTLMILYIFKSEIFYYIIKYQKEFSKLSIEIIFNLLQLFFFLALTHLRDLSPVISCFIDFFYLFRV